MTACRKKSYYTNKFLGWNVCKKKSRSQKFLGPPQKIFFHLKYFIKAKKKFLRKCRKFPKSFFACKRVGEKFRVSEAPNKETSDANKTRKNSQVFFHVQKSRRKS
ncbi:hypothetical protein ISTM_361 [Insectomime virus]|nr:hypothetical protein ISTM_361 [Insectomime virus]